MNNPTPNTLCKHGRVHTAKTICPQCLELGDIDVTNMKVSEHLTDALSDFFFFHFKHAFVDLVWFFQKLTNTGEFGPEGYFVKKGYWKDGKPTRTK